MTITLKIDNPDMEKQLKALIQEQEEKVTDDLGLKMYKKTKSPLDGVVRHNTLRKMCYNNKNAKDI